MGHLGELQAEGISHHGIDDIDAAAMDFDAGQGIGEQGLQKGGPQAAGAGAGPKASCRSATCPAATLSRTNFSAARI